MRRGLPQVFLLLALSLTATARAAPAEDSKLDNLSEDRADTAFVNAPDNVSSNATDEATSISARGTYNNIPRDEVAASWAWHCCAG